MVATPIGNLEDVTARALRVLRQVAVIAAEDTRRTSRLLARYGIDTPTTSLHAHNEATKSPAIIARLVQGDDVALVSDAGTPAISDPGQRVVRAALDRGVRVEAIPGPSAVMAALSASGLPADRFAFLGFPPIHLRDRKKWLDQLRRTTGTVVFFEAPHRIRETLRQLYNDFGDREVAIGRELTKAHEEWVRGPISSVLSRLIAPLGEYTVVVDIGQSANIIDRKELEPGLLAAEIGELTKLAGYTKRKAINVVARRHNLPPNEVYRAIEEAKKSVE
ncbi:MAG: 16S rRNA (cytidine(1402)-2'-O)-methyltransferase [Betaproteobacteria bacterium]